MSFPPLDLAGYSRRTEVPAEYIALVESIAPGFVDQQIVTSIDRIYGQLRKRYGRSLPFGRSAPVLVAAGTAPPGVALVGVPTLGSLQIRLQITTPGPIGTALFVWSADNGLTWSGTFNGTSWTGASAVAPSVVLGSTGLSATFPILSYSADNVYAAATPVPETILGWLVAFVDVRVLRKHGVSTTDPQIAIFFDEFKRVIEEVEKAANSKDGLFDLPVSADEGSNVTTGGPLWYTEASPYVSADRQEREGHWEDLRGMGTYGGSGLP